MSRPLVLLIFLILLVVGGLYLLAGRASEQPLTRIEKSVSLENLS